MVAILVVAGVVSVALLGGVNNRLAYAAADGNNGDNNNDKNSEKMMMTTTMSTAATKMDGDSDRYRLHQGEEGKALGKIASIQNDDKGQPAWVASGSWRLIIMPPQNNSTQSDAKFFATFTMVKLDGTSRHSHAISDFVMTNMSDNGNTTTLRGNATMTMKDGPQKNIPVTIKIMNHNTVSITLDPAVNSHLGNTPLYGIVTKLNAAYHEMSHMEKGAGMMAQGEGSGEGNKERERGNNGSAPQPAGTKELHLSVDIVPGAASKADKAYDPDVLTGKVGTEVTWKNKDTAMHTVTSGKNGSPDGVFDSKFLAPNKEFKFEFKNAGVFDYYCQLHPAMVGKVTIQ
jgi:plastocyanin